jgi:hypothetical protein
MKRLILIVASVLFALVISEGLARLFYHVPNSINVPQAVYDARGPIPIPNQHGSINLPEASFTYSNNSMGMRGVTEFGAKMKLRVLLLGDSMTYGLGVNDDQNFAYLLQQRLPQYEFVNAGNPNTGTDYALTFYRVLGRSLQPDIVILCFLENDFRDNQRHWYFDDDINQVPFPYNVTHPTGRKFPLRSWLVDHVRLVYISKQVINYYAYDKGLQPELTSRYLGALKDEVAKDGARFIVLYIPAKEHLNGSEEETAFMQLAHSLGLSPISVRTSVKLSDYLKEGHWNPSGHQVAAGFIASVIQSEQRP